MTGKKHAKKPKKKHDSAAESENKAEAAEETAGTSKAAAAKAYAKTQEQADKASAEEKTADTGAEENEEKKQQEPDYKSIAQKTAAEFDNFRKRVGREKQLWKREALSDFLKDFLPAFDDLDRALNEGEKAESYQIVHDGARLVRNNLWKALEKAGITPIGEAGQKFDPRFHEAMTMIPMPGAEPNSIVEVFQPGYMIGEFVVRPAKVVVAAAAPAPAPVAGETTSETPPKEETGE